MAQVRILRAVEDDIEDTLRYTLRRYGPEKYAEYAALIEEAFGALAGDPEVGRFRPEIDSQAWTHHISKRGRRARHLLLYRIVDRDIVEVLALAHDAMDLPRRWRSRSRAR